MLLPQIKLPYHYPSCSPPVGQAKFKQSHETFTPIFLAIYSYLSNVIISNVFKTFFGVTEQVQGLDSSIKLQVVTSAEVNQSVRYSAENASSKSNLER